MGPLTRRGIAAFEAKSGLRADGIADPELLRRLGIGGVEPRWTPWLDEARRLVGTAERRDTTRIAGWSEGLDLGRFDATGTPWCALFVAHCIAAALPGEALPTNPLGARNWLTFGKACGPAPGAVLVFWRGSKAGWSGHVGFYAGEDAEAFHVLGGNQSDAVTVARVAKSRLLGKRWPGSAPPQQARVVVAAASGALSSNEA